MTSCAGSPRAHGRGSPWPHPGRHRTGPRGVLAASRGSTLRRARPLLCCRRRGHAAGARRSRRDKGRQKRGGERQQIDLADIPARADNDPDLLLSLDEALEKLAAEDPAAAGVAQLHLFTGLSIDEAAAALGVSRATAYRNWTYARAWLQDALDEKP